MTWARARAAPPAWPGPAPFDRARAACLYDEASRDLILKLKHADRTDLAPLFARWLSRAAARAAGRGATLIAPVPLHRSRLFRRRYNQAAEIARPLARAAGRAPTCPTPWCARATPASQGGKSGRGRRRNVRGRLRGAARPARAGRRQAHPADRRRADHRRHRRGLRPGAAEGRGARAVDLAVVARVREAAERSLYERRIVVIAGDAPWPHVTIYTRPFCPYCARALSAAAAARASTSPRSRAGFDAGKQRRRWSSAPAAARPSRRSSSASATSAAATT